MGRLIVLALAGPLYALIFFFALTAHFAGAQPLTFVDQRSQMVSSSHFVYISRLQLHPNPVAPGFWVEAPLSFRHWLLIPGTDRQKWLFQNPREADFPRSVAFDPRRGFYLGFTEDSSIVRSRDGTNWQTIVRGPQLVKSLVCKGRCPGTGCADDLRELCSANVKDFFAQSKPRFAALTHRGDRFIGIISPEDDFDPYIEPLVVTSLDGVAWNVAAALSNSQWLVSCGDASLAHGAGVSVLACNTNSKMREALHQFNDSTTVFLSQNGRQWREIKPAKDRDTKLNGLLFAKNQFMAVGSDGYAYLSLNGSEWIQVPVVPGVHLTGLAYGNGQFVAIGQEGVIAVSADGLRWQHRQIAPNTLLSIAYSKGFFLVAEKGGRLHLSRDARRWFTFTPWQIRGLSELVNFSDVTHGNRGFVAVSENGVIAHSEDGRSWSVVHRSGLPLFTVRWGGGGYVAAGKERILYSQDGRLWRTVFREEGLEISSVTFGSAGFVAVWPSGLLFSPTGLSWQKYTHSELGLFYVSNKSEYARESIPDLTSLRFVAYGSGRYLVAANWEVARRGVLALFASPDAKRWKQLSLECWEPPIDLVFSGQRFLVAGWLEVTAVTGEGKCISLEPTFTGNFLELSRGFGNSTPFIARLAGNDTLGRYAILSITGSLFYSSNLKNWAAVASGDFEALTMDSRGKALLVGRDIALVNLATLPK